MPFTTVTTFMSLSFAITALAVEDEQPSITSISFVPKICFFSISLYTLTIFAFVGSLYFAAQSPTFHIQSPTFNDQSTNLFVRTANF